MFKHFLKEKKKKYAQLRLKPVLLELSIMYESSNPKYYPLPLSLPQEYPESINIKQNFFLDQSVFLRPFHNDLNMFFHIMEVSLPITVTVNCPISANAITKKKCILDLISLHIKRKLEIK